MAVRQQIFSDLTGGINNVNTKDTLNSSTRNTETPDMINVEYLELGGIKSMNGNVQVGDKQDSAIVGGFEYRHGNVKDMVIATYNGDVKIFNHTTREFDFIYHFNHQARRVSFCNMNGGVIASNGIDDLIFYQKGRHTLLSGTVALTEGSTTITGTSTVFNTQLRVGDSVDIEGERYFIDAIASDTSATLRTPAVATSSGVRIYLDEVSECNAYLTNPETPGYKVPIRGTAIQYYKGRLWVGGEEGLFYSAPGLYNQWDELYDAGTVGKNIYNDSSDVKSLGLFSDFLMVHKEYSSYILTITDVGTTIKIEPYTSLSCDSQQSWVVSNTKYFVYSQENMGIYPIGNRTIFSDRYIGDELSKKVRNIFKKLNTSSTDSIFALNYPSKRWMLFYLPLSDGKGSNNALIYDFQTKSWLRREVPQNVTIAFNYNNLVYIGTNDGEVLREFSGNTFNGKNIRAYYRSPWFNWFHGYTQSIGEFIMELALDYNNSFYVRSYKDGVTKYEQRNITGDRLLGEGLVWDGEPALIYNDTTWDNDEWVNTGFRHLRMLLPNNVFEEFQIEIGTETEKDGQGFALYGYGFRRVEPDEALW